jgi:hypothetical protein
MVVACRYIQASSSARKTVSGWSWARSITFFQPGLQTPTLPVHGGICKPSRCVERSNHSAQTTDDTKSGFSNSPHTIAAQRGPDLPPSSVAHWPYALLAQTDHMAQLLTHFGHLFGLQFCPRRSTPMFSQTRCTALPKLATPSHQAGAITARDLQDLRDGIAAPLHPHGLQASAGTAIFGLGVSPLEFLVLLFVEFKSSFCHGSIVRLRFV